MVKAELILNRIMGQRGHLWVGIGLLAVLFTVVHFAIGFDRLLVPWVSISLASLLVATGLTLVSYVTRTIRVYDYFLPVTNGGFGACLKLTLFHNLLNNLLPMRSGETSFPVLMRRYFLMPLPQSIAALLWFRVMDLHALIAIGLAALGSRWLHQWQVICLLIFWLGLAWVLFHLQQASAFAAIGDRLPPRWKLRFAQAIAGLPQTRGAFLRAFVWTIANWVVKLGIFAWILTLFAPMPAAAALIGAIGGDLTTVLPFHGVAGAGTYEAGVVSALVPFGIAGDAALMAAVNLHLFVLGSSLIGGVVGLLLRHKVRSLPVLLDAQQ